MALNGVWPGPPALGGGFNGFTTSCPTPPCFVPQSYVTLNSLIGNFPVTERTDLYSLRLDHNLSNNNRLMLRGAASPSDVTGIQVQAQGPQNFGQNAFSRTSTNRDNSESKYAKRRFAQSSEDLAPAPGCPSRRWDSRHRAA